jgi:uncharacterized protein (DUF2267 family)
MSATGLEVFDRTVQATHVWLEDVMEALGPDRQRAWRAVGAVLRALRDQLPVELAAKFGSQMPILVRGAYYEEFQPAHMPARMRALDLILNRIAKELSDLGRIDPRAALEAVLTTTDRHIDAGQAEKVRDALPEGVRELWPASVAPAAQ